MGLMYRRWRLFFIFVILISLMTLLSAVAVVLHDDKACDHEHCPLCAFLRHKSDALQPAAGDMTLFCTAILFFGIGTRKKIIRFTPVCLKVRMDR